MKLRQPEWPRQLPTPFVLGFARMGPIGRRLGAPGTWGSAAGLLYFLVFFPPLAPVGVFVLNALGLYLAVAFCGEAEIRLRRTDPGEIILDEFVAMPLCFLGWDQLSSTDFAPWVILLAGFALFRVFDILKPFGIKKLQSLNGGWGVMTDDAVAALATCGVLHAGCAIWG